MKAHLPDQQALTQALLRCLGETACAPSVEIVERRPNPYGSTYPCEIVTCRLGHSVELTLFCKYAAPVDEPPGGHRGGLWRESRVYSQILRPLGLGPKWYGSHVDVKSESVWLFVEYLGWEKFSFGPQPEAMIRGAQWIGNFHRATEQFVGKAELGWLPEYGADYYVSWARRAALCTAALHERFGWLAECCRQAEAHIASLADRPRSIIHGEYYPRNVMWAGNDVRPIDWESAAIGAGEIDLASLVMKWGPVLGDAATDAYCSARWPQESKTADTDALRAATLYWLFRWLGHSKEAAQSTKSAWLFEELHALSRISGLITG